AALAMLIMIIALPLVVFQIRISGRRKSTTVTGQYRNQVLELGRWRWPSFVLIGVVLLVVLGVPIVVTTAGTFMTAFGFLNIARPWTLDNWSAAFRDPQFIRSLANTVQLALGSAAIGLTLYALIAYVAVR